MGHFLQKSRLLTSLEQSIPWPSFHVCAFPQAENSRAKDGCPLWSGHVYHVFLLHSFHVIFLIPVGFELMVCILHRLTTLIQYLYNVSTSKDKTTWDLHSVMNCIVSPCKFICWISNLQSVCIGDRALMEVIKAKLGHKNVALFQYNLCPYTKRNWHERSIAK